MGAQEFYKVVVRSKTGLSGYCKKCHRAHAKSNRLTAANIERARARKKLNRLLVKIKADHAHTDRAAHELRLLAVERSLRVRHPWF